ncbi:hypothetical protein BIW11_09144 [Tropilaelaps mercedesae]|uniref:Uncharacterized protein n=1 Tax=Tropilaelaps mercedesae TaxID=418985 RepID=A0A1V9XLE3_9ACAR|nr:hypothetical protein BIW11_09144 [Tropilaelaps mercedesae]
MLPHPLVILLGVSCTEALMTSRDFHRLVVPECFRQGQTEELEDVPRTMKNFIELVNRIEKVHKLEDAAETASLLLRRFSMSYMRHKKTESGHMFFVDEAQEARASVAEVLLRSAPRQQFHEGVFTVSEKCALFFMLSHSIEQRNDGAGIIAYVEHGVVSPVVHPEGSHGLALAPTLFGIAASKYASRESTQSLLALLRPYSNVVSEGHSVVDHLYGPTLAYLLGTSVKWKNTTVLPLLGRNGIWTTRLCPREYKLSPKVSDVTDSQLSGAVDGFLLNVLSSRISKQRKRPFSLDQLLSTYYSSRGIRELVPEFAGGISFCTRGKIFHKLFSTERLTEQTLAIARLFNAVEALPLKEVIENYAVIPAVKKFSQELEHIVIHPPSSCQEVQHQLDKGSCQTLSNVLLLLDPVSGNPQFDVYQRKLSAYLSEKILENNANSRVSISSSSLTDNPHILKLFFSSSRKQKNPSCHVSRLLYRGADKGCAECQEADIWRAVNGTWNSLLEDDVEVAASTVTPSKVVVYFKFNDFRSKEEDLQGVIRGLRKYHKDLYIFVVGPKPQIVEKFRADVKDAVVIIPQATDDEVMQRIATELAYEICQSE